MKYALGLVALVAALGFAGATFSGGCAETFSIKGYTKAWFQMNGSENADPEYTFRGYNWTTFMGRLNENTYACLGANYKTWNGSSSLNVSDAYLSMNLIPELTVTAGQFKIPLGWEYNRSGGSLCFLDRAAVTGTAEFASYGGRDVGVNLHGQFDMVGIDLGVFNGTRSYHDAENYVDKQIVAKLTFDATDWLTIAGGMAMIGEAEHDEAIDTITVTIDEWSATGINAYALVDYPLSDNADLIFEAEFWQMGFAGPDMANADEKAAVSYYGTLGVDIGLENAIFSSIMPAVRYESYSPQELVPDAADEAENNTTVMDFALNCFINPYNAIQIGGRNVGYEADIDGYTDMYLCWRLNY